MILSFCTRTWHTSYTSEYSSFEHHAILMLI